MWREGRGGQRQSIHQHVDLPRNSTALPSSQAAEGSVMPAKEPY